MKKIEFLFMSFICMLSVQSAIAAPPTIVLVSPTSQSLSSTRNTPIVITFDVALDPASVTQANISVFGRWTGVVNGTLQLEGGNTRIRFTPSTTFNAGDMILVTVAKGIRSQTGENLVRGYSWFFWAATSVARLDLSERGRVAVRRAGEGHIQTYGAHGCDFNKDGFSDFFVPNEISNDSRIFINDGTGNYSNFAVLPMPGASRPSTNDAADFNRDGNPDIAVGSSAGDSVTVFLGNGTGGFLSVKNHFAAGGVRGLSVGDLDGDGDADIVTANRSGNNIAILLNTGSGSFAPRSVMEAGGGGETACALADANGDGVLDLFVGAYTSAEIILLLGNGNGTFTFSNKVAAGGGGPWMIAVGDVNGDGNVDVVSANSNSSNTSVVMGNGLGGLAPAVTYAVHAFPIAIDLGDLDGDGDLDLVLSNYAGGNWNVFENNGSGTFVNRRSLAASIAGSCATLHDRDNDGDLDITGIDEEADLIFLFENRLPTSVDAILGRPKNIALRQNYPNPFNPQTTISFELERPEFTTLTVFNTLGQNVATLVNQPLGVGFHRVEFTGIAGDGNSLPGGVYMYRLQTSAGVGTRKMILLK